MTEKQLAQAFKSRLSDRFAKEDVKGFYYKIPDTRGLGGLRPFDAFLLIEGSFIAIEFKKNNRKLEAHQQYWMNYIKVCKGNSVVVTQENYQQLIERFIIGSRLISNLAKGKRLNIDDLKKKKEGGENNG